MDRERLSSQSYKGYHLEKLEYLTSISTGLLLLQDKYLLLVPKVWSCPPIGFFKLNFDGASKGNPGQQAMEEFSGIAPE
jgi:hypothetical protein